MILKKLLVNKSNNTFVQIFRYLFAGGGGFVADFLTLFLLTHYFDVYYLTSATIGFVVGVSITYIISVMWVFQSRSHRSRLAEFGIFCLIGIIGLGLTLGLIWILTEKLHLFYLVSKIIATVIIYFWNFFARKQLLFNDHMGVSSPAEIAID